MTLGYFEKIGLLFSQPINFFKEVSKEGISNAFLLYLIVALITQVVSALISFSILGSMGMLGLGMGMNPFYTGVMGVMLPFMLIFGLILGVAFTFVWAGIVHLFAMIFQAKGSYTETYKATTYSAVPALIIIIIPYIFILGIIYGIILSIFGIKELHKMSTGKAVATVLIPVLILVFLFILLFITVLA